MFGIGGPELVFIFILALLIFGPKRLPQIGRTIGKGMAEFRRASTELQRAVNTQLEEPETPAWRAQPAATAAPAPAISAALPAGTVAASAASSAAAPHASSEPPAAELLADFGAALEADAARQAAEPAAASPEPAPEPITPTQLQ
ncbi:MAG TPA: twin-arginine translocase TatA/TatE family subunit [Thermoanaerobaculia bacterium]|nr:twin-arginine translocase TatA/TatE family subunit [Thermoanaerobaculia bacterium]